MLRGSNSTLSIPNTCRRYSETHVSIRVRTGKHTCGKQSWLGVHADHAAVVGSNRLCLCNHEEKPPYLKPEEHTEEGVGKPR